VLTSNGIVHLYKYVDKTWHDNKESFGSNLLTY